MDQMTIRPQEIYLLERYSSVAYFKEMVDAFAQMLAVAESALNVFMQDLPVDYRARSIAMQPDIVWGELVLPNFRSTCSSLQRAYQDLLAGDLTALEYAANVKADFRMQRGDYWPDWMDKAHLADFYQWQAQAGQNAFNIELTVLRVWKVGSLSTLYDEDARGPLDLPKQAPLYQLRPDIFVKTGDIIQQDGIYIPMIAEASAQLLFKNYEALRAYVGLNESGQQCAYRADTTWVLVERVADAGGSFSPQTQQFIKCLAGEICPQSGDWFSPAQAGGSQYFQQGDTFPMLRQSDWGEVYWYYQHPNSAE